MSNTDLVDTPHNKLFFRRCGIQNRATGRTLSAATIPITATTVWKGEWRQPHVRAEKVGQGERGKRKPAINRIRAVSKDRPEMSTHFNADG